MKRNSVALVAGIALILSFSQGCGGGGGTNTPPTPPAKILSETTWQLIGLDGKFVTSLVIDPTNSQIVYAGTNYYGVYKTSNGGNSWTYSGLTGTCVSKLVIDPMNSQIVYAGTNGGGVFKTTDGGASWTPINTGLGDIYVLSLAVDPTNSQIIYAGTILHGVFKSSDGGAFWTDMGAYPVPACQSLAIDPANSQIVYAATGDIFKTTNGGALWTQIAHFLNGAIVYVSVRSLVIDPTNSQIIYAGTNLGGVFKTTDGGASWPQIADFNGVQSLAIDPANSQIVYAGTGSGVFKTTDGGASWTPIMTSVGVASFAVDSSNSQVVYVGAMADTYGIGGGVFKIIPSETCTYGINPESNTVSYAGGTGSIIVTPSSGSCAWTATSNASWITITSGSSGTGNGTVSYSVAANTTSSPQTGTITVGGKTFTITVVNIPPYLAPTGGGTYQINTVVTIGGQVSDLDGDLLTYTWLEGATVLTSGTIQAVKGGSPVGLPPYTINSLALGKHIFTVSVTDGINPPVSADIIIEIVDTTAPSLAPTADKSILWPANHKMVDITIFVNARDNSGGPVALTATVSSNEPQDGLGDGDTSPDWTEPVIKDGFIKLQLRAERSGQGNGRIYTIAIVATDQSGNSSTAKVNISVPHDKGK